MNEFKKELLINSKKIIEDKEDITSLNDSKGGYIDSIKEAFRKDNVNRKEFLKKNSLVAGLSLEFRNIYGIEPPYYDINRKTSIAFNQDTGSGLSAKKKLDINTGKYIYPINVPDFDGTLKTEFADCQELINAAYFEKDSKDNVDRMTNADKQRFFVDSKKREESSQFFEPFCPPGLNKWSGSYLHDLICKNYDTTELDLYNMLNGSGTLNKNIEVFYEDVIEETLSFAQIAIRAIKKVLGWLGIRRDSDWFSCDKPIISNTDESGKISRHNFQYNVSDEQLEAAKESGMISFDIDNGGVDVSPSIYYKTSSGLNKTSISKFELREKNSSSNFCSGYAILSRHPDTSSAFTISIITKSGQLFKPETQDNHRFLWWKWTTPNKHLYKAIFKPAKISDSSVKKAILTYYKNMLEEAIYYYDYYTEVNKGGCKIDIEESYKSMKKIVSRIKTYRFLPTSNNFNKAMSAIRDRLENIVYKGSITSPKLPPDRAVIIDEYLKSSPDFFKDLFTAVSNRIDKRTGTMREVYRLMANTGIAFSSIESKMNRLLASLSETNAFSINSGFGTEKITVQLEPWEDVLSFSASITPKSIVYVACDENVSVLGSREPIFQALITDVNQTMYKKEKITYDEYGDSKIEVVQRDAFEITLSRKVPNTFKELNPRIVRKVIGLPTLQNKLKGFVDLDD